MLKKNMNDAEGWIKNKLRSLMKNYSDQYVACSNFVREYAQKKYGIKKPFSVIYPGVVTKRFKSISPLEFHNPMRLLLLGRLTKQKGQEFALRALAGVKNFPWFLSIVGEGEDKKYLQNLVAELEIGDWVTFLPPIREVENLYKENDVLLVPSLWEGFGMVAAEAMSAGRLVVASAAGGLKEIVEEGGTGFLFKKSDQKSFQNTLNYIYRNKKMMRQIVVRGKEFVENNFGVEKMVDEYNELYRRWKR
jgi:glycosyltransferase involved in cell wall biosynthesis